MLWTRIRSEWNKIDYQFITMVIQIIFEWIIVLIFQNIKFKILENIPISQFLVRYNTWFNATLCVSVRINWNSRIDFDAFSKSHEIIYLVSDPPHSEPTSFNLRAVKETRRYRLHFIYCEKFISQIIRISDLFLFSYVEVVRFVKCFSIISWINSVLWSKNPA